MTVKEWLNRGYRLDVEVNTLLGEQADTFRRTSGAPNIFGGEKVQTSKRNSAEDVFVNYAAYSELIDRRIDELYAIKAEIKAAINAVEDNTLRMILILRHVEFKKWEQIAEKTSYSERQVYRLYKKALKKAGEVIPLPDNS